MIIAIGSIVFTFVIYTWLMLENLKRLRETKQEPLEARRIQRKNRPYIFRDIYNSYNPQ